MSTKVLKALMDIPCIGDAAGIAGYDAAMAKQKVRELADRISDARDQGINNHDEIMKKVFTDLFNERKSYEDYTQAARLKQALVIDKTIKAIDTNYPDDVVKGIQSVSSGTEEVSARAKVNNRKLKQTSVQEDYHGRLLQGLDDAGVLVDFQNDLHALDRIRENRGENTGNERAKKMNDVYTSILKPLIEEARANGMPIRDMEHFMASISRESGKLLDVHESQWDNIKHNFAHPIPNYLRDKALAEKRYINNMKEWMHHGKTFKGSDPDEFLHHTYSSQTIFDSAKESDANDDTLALGGLAVHASKARVLIHKDAESFLKDIKTYGNGSYSQTCVDTIQKMAKHIGTAQEWGTKPSTTFNAVLDILKKRPGIGDNQNIVKDLAFQRRVFDEYTGKASIPISKTWNDVTNAVLAWKSSTTLGASAIHASTDVCYVAASLTKNFDESGIHAFGSALSNYFRHMLPGATKETLASIGHSYELQTGHGISSMGWSLDNPSGSMAKIFQQIHTFNRVTWNDETLVRGVIFESGMRLYNLRMHTLDAMPDLKAQAFLKRYGFTGKEWDLMRHNGRKFDNGAGLITADDPWLYSKEDISKHLGIDSAELTKPKIEDVRTQIRRKILGMMKDETMYSYMTQNDVEKAWMRFGSHGRAGTPMGSFAKMIGQFQTWPLAEAHRFLATLIDPIKKASGVGETISASKALINYAVSKTITALISRQIKAIVTGNPIEDPREWTTWEHAMLASVPIIGDMALNLLRASQGSDFVDNFLGPTGEGIIKLADIMTSMTQKVTHHGRYNAHLSKKFFKLGESNVPYLNLFYIKSALNYMFLDSLEHAIDPGAKNRRVRNARKNKEIYVLPPR